MSTLTLFLIEITLFFSNSQIISQLNPGCSNCTAENTLIYVKAIGSHDTVHQIWDFTRGVPTILFAIADVNSSYTILWNDTKPLKFVLDQAPKYIFGASLEKVCTFTNILVCVFYNMVRWAGYHSSMS